MHSEKNKNLTSIVIPMYNEAESLPELLRAIRRGFSGIRYEVIFVDDGSSDSSYTVLLKEHKKSAFPMTVIRLRKRCGKSAALAEGFRHASGGIIVTMDADLQDDPSEARKLIDVMKPGIDCVVGWRKIRRDSKSKLGVSHVFNSVVSYLSGLTLHDMNCGLKVMRKEVANELRLYGELHRFIPVLAHTRGFRVVEYGIAHHPRKYGTSKFGLERTLAAFDLMTTMFISGYGTRPLVVFGPPGILLIGVGSVALLYLVAVKATGESIGTRPLLLFGVLFILFGFQLLSTGLLGELIVSTIGDARKMPVREVFSS